MTRRTTAWIACALLLPACSPGADEPSPPATPTELPTVTAHPLAAPDVRGRIVVAGDDGEIHLVRLPSGRDEAITAIRGDRFDPDGHGDLIVFRDSRDGVNVDDEIYVARANGEDVRNLTNAPGSNEWGPAWSPDGTRIAFNSDREGTPQVYVMNADGGDVRRLSDVWGEYPAWSPDGTRIAFGSYAGGTTPFGDPNYDVFVMDADGSNEMNLTDDPDAYDMYPTWSPGGRWIAFESTRGTPDDFAPPPEDPERTSDFDIWLMRPDGSDMRNVTANLETLEKFPDWSRAGIVYVRHGELVVVTPDGSRELDLTERYGVPGNFPAWVT